MGIHKRPLFLLGLLLGSSLAKPFTQHRRDDEVTAEQIAERIADSPEECTDFLNPSEECLQAIEDSMTAAEDNPDDFIALGGGLLIWERNSGCERQSDVAQSAFDASQMTSRTVLESTNAEYGPIWDTWIGPNHKDYKDRIVANLNRISDFRPHNKYNIYMTCKDPHNVCDRVVDGRPLKVGGYAWTKKGWFGSYSYINLCEIFFSLDTLSTKAASVDYNQRNEDGSYAKQAVWQKNMALYFLHEMMHLDVTSGSEPHITDEYVDPQGAGGAAKAYGPPLVYKLAQRPTNQGGGAKRASTNADSYAWLANSAYFYHEFGEYPLPKNYKPKSEDAAGPVTTDDLSDNGPVWFDLGNFGDQNVTEEDFEDRLDEAVQGLGLEEIPDEDPSNGSQCDDVDDGFDEDAANAAIDDFCDNVEQWKDTVIVPPIATGTGETKDGRGKALGIYNEGPSVEGTDAKIWLGVGFAQDNCVGSFSIAGEDDTQKDIDDCKSNLKAILSDCGGSGGTLRNTCDVWYVKVSTNNPSDDDWEDRGEVECGDICPDDECRETLGNGPLSDACSCWYSNYDTVTATFARPDSGSCDPDEVDRAYEFPG